MLQIIIRILKAVGLWIARNPWWLRIVITFGFKYAIKKLLKYIVYMRNKHPQDSRTHDNVKEISEGIAALCDLITMHLGINIKPKQMIPGYKSRKVKREEKKLNRKERENQWYE